MSAENAQYHSTRSEESHDSDGSSLAFTDNQLSTALIPS